MTDRSGKSSQDNNNDNSKNNLRIGGGWILLAVSFTILGLSLLSPTSNGRQQVAYSQFLEQVEAGNVEEATIAPDQIEYELKPAAVAEGEPETRITRPVPSDDNLTELLRANDVEFSAVAGNDAGWLISLLGWIVPPLLFIGLFIWLSRRAAGGGAGGANPLMSVGQSKARIYTEGKTDVGFDDVAGVDEAKEELVEVVDYLKNAQKYRRLGAQIPKGVLLVGPPGTGKTLLAKAVAGEAGVPFISISGSEFVEMFVGVGASRVRDLFKQGKEQAPCIIFIDELDALGKSRAGQGASTGGAGNDEQEQTLNQLLNEMDGFDPNVGVMILAATNRPEVLDPALQRPGRFDRRVLIDRPDKIGRKAILEVHAPKVKLADDVNLERLALRTPGFAGADLANLVNEAALLAARENRDSVTMADFNEAIERLIAGLEKKSRVLNDTEKKTVAYHEVGHAMVGSLMPGAGRVEKISIVPRGQGALGFTLQLPEEERFLVAEDEIRGRIAILLAGRSSEELIFGKISTGASDDIQKATELAERCVTLYGMSDRLGPIAYEKPQQQFLPGMGSPRRPVSQQVTEAIDAEVKRIIDEAHEMAYKILAENQAVLNDIAGELIEEETIEAKALAEKLRRVRRPEGFDRWLQEPQFSNKLTQSQ